MTFQLIFFLLLTGLTSQTLNLDRLLAIDSFWLQENTFMVVVVSIIVLSALIYLMFTIRRQSLLNRRLMTLLEQRHKQIDSQKDDLEATLQEMISLKERAEAANDTKTHFLANISHEIRTPLNGILGMLSILRQNTKIEDMREGHQEIAILTQNLMSIVNDMLDYAKLESNLLQLDHLNFNLHSELREVTAIYKKRAAEKDLEFISRIDENLPLYAKGDFGRLKQIVNNLLSNALKFTEAGSIKFTADLIREHHNKIQVRIRVIDSGVGISEAEQQKIWEVFQLGDESYTRRHGGSGLGLTISRKLVELMNGNMGLTSKPNEGSTFWFTVELEKGIEPSLLDAMMPKKILLVEDNLINQKVSLHTLHTLGFEVDLAENGQIAIEKYKQNQYDLILMDIQMPVMDGITATKIIRQLELKKKPKENIQIVAITANSLKDDRQKCLEAGMNEYISKPFDLEKFPLIISQLSFQNNEQLA